MSTYGIRVTTSIFLGLSHNGAFTREVSHGPRLGSKFGITSKPAEVTATKVCLSSVLQDGPLREVERGGQLDHETTDCTLCARKLDRSQTCGRPQTMVVYVYVIVSTGNSIKRETFFRH